MPDAAEIVSLMLELHNWRNQRGLRKPSEHRIFNESSESTCEGDLLCWCDVLVSKENRKMIEQGQS